MSIPSPSPTPVKISEPADIVALVPWLIGFVPEESIVVVGLHGPRRRTGLTLRMDLPSPEDYDGVARHLAARAALAKADAAVLLCYTEAADVDGRLPAADFVELQLDAWVGRDIECLEALLVRGGRWFSYRCRQPCCPPEGTPLPGEDSAVALRCAAEAAVSGQAVLRNRGELERSVRGPVALRAIALEQVCDRVLDDLVVEGARSRAGLRDRVLALGRARLEAHAAGARDLSDEDAATIVLAMADRELRDELGTWCLDHPPDVLLPFLIELAQRALDPVCPPVCTVLAWAAYAYGNGGLANVALDRALGVDPDYHMANLIRDGLDRQVAPSVVRDVTRQTREDLAERRRSGQDRPELLG